MSIKKSGCVVFAMLMFHRPSLLFNSIIFGTLHFHQFLFGKVMAE